MNTGPKRPCRRPGCSQFAAPGGGYCAAHVVGAQSVRAAVVARHDQVRGNAYQRGYDTRWSAYAVRFKSKFPSSAGYLTRTELWTPHLARQFHTLRELAAQSHQWAGFFRTSAAGARFLAEFPIYDYHAAGAAEPSKEVDHIVPVEGPADPLFWAEWNHQALTKAQHSEKTARFDGGFRGGGAAKKLSTPRDFIA
jgi:hypothetical protein